MLSRIGPTLVVLLCLLPPFVAAAASPVPLLSDKTLVVWATVADRAQRGGSLLTLQEDESFDAMVYGERVPQRWMAGSDFFRRTQAEESQVTCLAETAATAELVQIAVVYAGKRITLYRNGHLQFVRGRLAATIRRLRADAGAAVPGCDGCDWVLRTGNRGGPLVRRGADTVEQSATCASISRRSRADRLVDVRGRHRDRSDGPLSRGSSRG